MKNEQRIKDFQAEINKAGSLIATLGLASIRKSHIEVTIGYENGVSVRIRRAFGDCVLIEYCDENGCESYLIEQDSPIKAIDILTEVAEYQVPMGSRRLETKEVV